MTFARGDRSVAISNDTARSIRRELDSSESGRELHDRIADWDPDERLVLSDEESALVQQAADYAMMRKPPAGIYDELQSLRSLRD